ncbi:Serpin (serine protease inhibitor) [Popillia japonica]|uniref:Serpin (Serine protease inhibitor) n=1 Tax=Popillia japonica TaxID=7064 RepID=A0AAW1LBB0_POPJA
MTLLYTSLLITVTVTIICANDVPISINYLAYNLYKTISKPENLIFSPFSAHSALSLAYEGTGGQTTSTFQDVLLLPDQNATALGYKSMMDTLNSAQNVQLNIANKIYLQSDYKLKEDFRSIAQNYFEADADTIDFSQSSVAAEEINNWVKEKTQNKIDKLFDSDAFDSETRAVLLNAIYFKGNWLSPFRKESTRIDKFYTSDTEFIMHPMMFQEAYCEYTESAKLDAKILTLEYENTRFAMTIVLPNSKMGIVDLEQKLFSLDALDTAITTNSKDKVLLTLPKFKIESTLKLEDPLKEIGLQDIFTNSANFSNMIEGEPNLRINQVIQKAFIEVNEEGAEAAAATGIEAGTLSLVSQQPVFKADHPFMFYISETTGPGTILFLGKVLSPTYEI